MSEKRDIWQEMIDKRDEVEVLLDELRDLALSATLMPDKHIQECINSGAFNLNPWLEVVIDQVESLADEEEDEEDEPF